MSLKQFNAKLLSHQESDVLISQFVSSIVERCDPLRVIIFGSASRHELTDCSDIDAFVITGSTQETKEARRLYYAQKPAVDWPADIFFMSREEFQKRSLSGGICMIAKDEGIVAYEKGAS